MRNVSIKSAMFAWSVFFTFAMISTMSAEKAGTGKKIGVMWIGKSGMANRVDDGLESRLSTQSPGMSVDVKKDLTDEKAAAPIYEAWQKEKDGIVFLRSNGAAYIAKHKPKVPTFIGGCNNPQSLGAVENLQTPEGNVTGVTYFLKPKQHLNLYRTIFPKLKSIGLILEKGHPSAIIDQEGTKKACAAMGISYSEVLIDNKDEIKRKTAELAPKVDLLVIGNQALVIDNAKAICEGAGKTPVASYAEKPVTNKQALVGLVPSDKKLGQMLADSVIAIVVDGKPVKDVPVKMDDQPRILICSQKMRDWNARIPMKILKVAELIK